MNILLSTSLLFIFMLSPRIGFAASDAEIKGCAALSQKCQPFIDGTILERQGISPLDHWGFGIDSTEQYGQFYPCVPILHPYDPNGNDGQSSQYSIDDDRAGVLKSSIRLKLPAVLFYETLPKAVQAATLGVPLVNLELYFITQDLPWIRELPILFRPHYWLDPKAPEIQAGYNRNFNTDIQFFHGPNDLKIAGTDKTGAPFQTHTADHLKVVSSPNNCPVTGIPYDEDFSFFSLVKSGDRTAVTMHSILSSKAQRTLDGCLSAWPIPGKISLHDLDVYTKEIEDLRNFRQTLFWINF
ncbi:MAG: hypothetical protein NTX76_01190 [Alphaproteobacteria bacterium]|nr:hypothetical protein [Alphaproteobacteria bacterium]